MCFMQTVQQLFELADSDRFEATYDVAVANLVCAQGLPGSENLSIEVVIDWIEDAARRVEFATQLNYPKFLDHPGQFANSQAIFCTAMLMTVLRQELSVRYNPKRKADSTDFRSAQDSFLHGITHGEGGTCASLPVIVAAVGRRLGYPLKLVKGTQHLFCRWDGGEGSTFLTNDRFNIEATAHGLVCQPDDYYLRWPFAPTFPEYDPKEYLKSLSPREELAMFFANRAFVLMDNGKYVRAIESFTTARRLAPGSMSYRAWQDVAFLLGLAVPLEMPPEAQNIVLCSDGIARRPVWWPHEANEPEHLPAAALPPDLVDQMIPPPSPNMMPGSISDALLAHWPRLIDAQWVNETRQRIEAERCLVTILQHNSMVQARREAMLAEVQRINAINAANWRKTIEAAGAWVVPPVPKGHNLPPLPASPQTIPPVGKPASLPFNGVHNGFPVTDPPQPGATPAATPFNGLHIGFPYAGPPESFGVPGRAQRLGEAMPSWRNHQMPVALVGRAN